jgi:hypothetical protein
MFLFGYIILSYTLFFLFFFPPPHSYSKQKSHIIVLISIQPGATTRKGVFQVERQNSEISYYADDEDGNRNKYAKRGK